MANQFKTKQEMIKGLGLDAKKERVSNWDTTKVSIAEIKYNVVKCLKDGNYGANDTAWKEGEWFMKSAD